MFPKLFAVVFTLGAVFLPAFPADSCPITEAPAPAFVPPAPFHTAYWGFNRGFLFGNNSLWTWVDPATDIKPNSTGPRATYFFKLVYWLPGLSWDHAGERPSHLKVVARRLDDPAAPIVFTERTNKVGLYLTEAQKDADAALMTGLELPTGGCWEVAAGYEGSRVTYVL